MTRETLEKLPQNVRTRVESFRNQYRIAKERDISGAKANVTAARSASAGYMQGLKDAGLITDAERQILFIYTTV